MREIIIYAVTGFLFCFFQRTGYDLARQGNIEWTYVYILRTVGISLAGGICIGVLVHQLTGRRGAIKASVKSKTVRCHAGEACDGVASEAQKGCGNRKTLLAWRPWQVWLVSFFLLVLCWLPCYLAYYPGICAYDATIQTGQIVGGSYNDHHPIAHTLLIAGGMRLGQALFGDVNKGIGLLVLIQMLSLAAVYAWGVTVLQDWRVSRRYPVVLQLLGMFYPFHMYMSVSLIKDVLFSAFFLLQILALCEIVGRRERGAGRYDILFLTGTVGLQLFRNNGRYAMLVLLVILFAAVIFDRGSRRFWVKLAANCLLGLILGSLCLTGLFRAVHAEQGDRREMLSMPIQQLARCMLYHGGVGELGADDGTMDQESRALINDFLLDEGYRLYRPEISDPVKSHTNTYVVRYRAGDFIRTYLHLLKEYPGDFINAALAVNAGYLYVDDISHANVNRNGVDAGLGYVQTRWVENELNPRGIYKDSKWEWLHEKLERWADENDYLKVPVLKYLFVPGVFLWLYALAVARLIARKKYVVCVPFVPVFGYYLTLFLGPTVQLRYLYPLMLALPFLAGWMERTPADRDMQAAEPEKRQIL